MFSHELAAKAAEIGASRKLLRNRLGVGRAVLSKEFRPFFRKPKFQFTSARLLGTDGYYLQWENNGETSIGSVSLCRK